MYAIDLLPDRLQENENHVVSILKKIDARSYDDAIKEAEALITVINSIKDSASEEIELNATYILTIFFKFLISLSVYWRHIESESYHESWCALQDGIDYLRTLKRFYPYKKNKVVCFFEKQLIKLETLYPYKLFSSPGFIVDRFECSICGNDIDSDLCPHMKGELYFGEIAYAVARNIKDIDHFAIVTNPTNKRLTIGCDDSHAQFNLFKDAVLHFNERKLSPLGFSNVELYEFVRPDPEWVKLPRNSICYCGSGKKYKKCCINNSGKKHVHVDFMGSHILS